MKQNQTSRPTARGSRGQRGQTLLIFGLMFVFLMGIVGLATDSAFAYFRSTSIERAAAAAALAGVPYMPKNFDVPVGSQNASARALDEAARNGFVDGVGGVTVTPARTTGERELAVSITAPSPTFFMNALLVRAFNITRRAVAGYKPPIALGQSEPQAGATVSQLGSGSNFYFARYKGWSTQRSEGDPFTPNPNENTTGGNNGATSGDLHQFSQLNGVESTDLNCAGGPFKLPCRGGYNWRIVVPAGQTALVQVYNAADAPNFSSDPNKTPIFGNKGGNPCENAKNPLLCNPISGYNYHEDDMGAGNHCQPTCTTGQQDAYNATAYTLLDVPNVFLRSQDKVLSQTTVFPIDATNYDGNQGNTGLTAGSTPTYTNVTSGEVVQQYYIAAGNPGAGQPCNMLIYHAWMDVTSYTGNQTAGCSGGDGALTSLVKQYTPVPCGVPCKYNNPDPTGLSPTGAALGPGTYRLRVDALNHDGALGPTDNTKLGGGNSSKGYAVRVVDAGDGTPASCVGCTVSGWQDMCIYTPIKAGTGILPLFKLTSDYAGSTIDIDIYDVGDSAGQVLLGIIDPTTGALASLGATGSITNDGITRLTPGTAHTPPQYPVPKALGTVVPSTPGSAEYEAANGTYGKEYQGSWVRISIPIPSDYNPVADDFWKLQYKNTDSAGDTFTFTVTARGGPVQLLKS